MDNKRLLSIDALRGFDMFFIMGFASLVVSVCRLFPDGGESWLVLLFFYRNRIFLKV